MNGVLTIFLIAISLSMDAFSLSLIYGTLNLDNKRVMILSIVVGICHFIMPMLGSFMGIIILNGLHFPPNYFVSALFFIIAFEMLISNLKEERPFVLDYLGIILFGLAVSIDSFLTGVGLWVINDNILLCSITFMVFSSLFTYIGLNIGGKINILFGKISSILAIALLILLAFYYLIC